MIEKLKKNVMTAPILVLVVGVLTVLVGTVLKKLNYTSVEELFLTYSVAELLIFVLPGIFYVKLKPRGYATKMNLVSFGFTKLPLVLLMFLAMAFGSVLMNILFAGGNIGGELAENALEMADGDYISDARMILYVALTLGVIPAFAEEFIFRGILLCEYRKYGMFPSVLITSALFAMLHFDFVLFPVYFLSGIALGFTAYAARSAVMSAILHALFNLFSLFFLPLVLNFISMETGSIVLFIAAVCFLLCLLLALGEAERLFSGYSQAAISSEVPEKRSKKKTGLFPSLEMLSPTFLVCVLLFVLGALNVISIPAQF